MEIREVGLPELVGAVRGMWKRFRRREQTKAGLVITSYAFKLRSTLDSERHCPSRSVKAHASSRGGRSGAASAASTTRCRTRGGIRFQERRATDGRRVSPFSPPSAYRRYHVSHVARGTCSSRSGWRTGRSDPSTRRITSCVSAAVSRTCRPPSRRPSRVL